MVVRRPHVGPRIAAELLEAFGSPEAVFAADREALTRSSCGLTKAQVDALSDKDTGEAERIIADCAKKDIRLITPGDDGYPGRLRAIADPPLTLYVRGRWPDFDVQPGIAVVGTREATPLRLADRRGHRRGARPRGFCDSQRYGAGNDGAAHRGALRAGA